MARYLRNPHNVPVDVIPAVLHVPAMGETEITDTLEALPGLASAMQPHVDAGMLLLEERRSPEDEPLTFREPGGPIPAIEDSAPLEAAEDDEAPEPSSPKTMNRKGRK